MCPSLLPFPQTATPKRQHKLQNPCSPSQQTLLQQDEMSSSSFTGNQPGDLQYCNKYCKCGKVADIKVSTTLRNPSKLFYTCRTQTCGFFQWCLPVASEGVHSPAFPDEVTNEESQCFRTNARLTAMEKNVKLLNLLVLGVVVFISLCFFTMLVK